MWLVWNCFKTGLFLLHRAANFNIADGQHHRVLPSLMIVCSCNVLTDHDVRSAVTAAEDFPRTARQVYGCLGCSAECGRCARTIKKILDEALGACAKACCSGCPHSQASAEFADVRADAHVEPHLHPQPAPVEIAA